LNNQSNATRLPVLVNINTATRYVLDSPSTTIGRDPENKLVIPDDEYCSADHARIYWDQGKLMLEDLNSSNGTAVNDQILHGTRPLAPGDVIKFGRTMFRIE
jgi:two-component system, cell cycle response regulator